MPITWTIPSPTRTDDLIAHANRATPAYWSGPGREHEDTKAIAAALRLGADDPVNLWLRMAYIEYAEGVWLDAHGRDQALPRVGGESDAAYRIRLRQVEDAVTPVSLLDAANQILTANGIGNAQLVELPRDAMYLGTSNSAIRHCLSRGRRLMTTGKPTVIVICPPGTPAAVVAAVAAAVGAKKAGGVSVIVEPN